MSQKINQELRASRAYQVFLEEFNKGLQQFEHVLVQENLPSGDDLQKLSSDFHRVKGGAGFFGLSKVSELAGKAEDLLSDIVELSAKDKEALQNFVAEMRKEKSELDWEES